MKIAIAGKGGVGKTTLSGVMARYLAEEGYTVLAIDADPDANLASALGFPPKLLNDVTPLAAMTPLVEERTGAQKGTFGGVFKLNPKVDDIPDTYSVTHHGVKLLIVGGRGLGTRENVQRLKETAHAMGAEFGISRPVALNAWGGMHRLIGVSGTISAKSQSKPARK